MVSLDNEKSMIDGDTGVEIYVFIDFLQNTFAGGSFNKLIFAFSPIRSPRQVYQLCCC